MMGFQIETGVPALTVFVQGLLSFFSPCVLPLVPLYISYFAGGMKTTLPDGSVRYPRGRVLVHTLFFVMGISVTFFLLGFGFTALGQFFSSNRLWFARISGIIMVLFGLYQLGALGHTQSLERERRLPFRLDKWAMSPVTALLLGFTFSFAWTPCVGPTLGSVLLMAGSSGTRLSALLLIGIYTLGFILPFLAVGLFTGAVLDFFKKHRNVVRYTVKIGAVLLIVMGIMTFTGGLNRWTSYLSDFGGNNGSSQAQNDQTTQPEEEPSETLTPAVDFTLTDQFGKEHKLSDYRGKTVFLNFWATWCSPCRGEMPEIQALYESYGSNEKDLIVLGVAGPGLGREGSVDDVRQFLSDNGYSFPVVMDESGQLFTQYGITTFMIDRDGNVFGYAQSALTGDMMESIVQQTMTGKRQSR